MCRADNPTTFMCRFSWNLGASTSWNPQGLSRPLMGLLYLLLPFEWVIHGMEYYKELLGIQGIWDVTHCCWVGRVGRLHIEITGYSCWGLGLTCTVLFLQIDSEWAVQGSRPDFTAHVTFCSDGIQIFTATFRPLQSWQGTCWEPGW